MSFNLATILSEGAKAHPDKPLIHFLGTRWTYQQVDELSGRVADGLRALGLQRDQKVAVQLPNVPEFIFAYFAVLKAGLVMVPLAPLLRAPEVAYHLENSDAAVLITYDGIADEALKGAAGLPDLQVFVLAGPKGRPAPEGTRSFGELYPPATPGIPDSTPLDGTGLPDRGPGRIEQTEADDTAVLLYTSGTTGHPKGAELSHFQLLMACSIGGETFGYRSDDIAVLVLPLFHIFGLSSTLNVTVRFGGSAVLLPRFEVGAVLDALERHRCTIFCGVPTMFIALLNADLTGRDVSSLSRCVSGGAAIPGEVVRGFEEKFSPAVILEAYGLSETVALATINPSAHRRRALSVGRPAWGVDIRILDAQGRDLPSGPAYVGELVIRGLTVMKRYYKNPEATAEAVHDGWLHTGDLGYRDEDGYFFIVDRKKDLIIRGGFNVYPREIEEVLHAHPAVEEASVVGKPDQRLGEEVVAFVTLRNGAETTPGELTAHCRERLARYKFPRQVIIMPALPKGSSGKVLKAELRARL